MTRHLRLCLITAASAATLVFVACVGDEPTTGGSGNDSDASTDATSDGTTAGDGASGCSETQTQCGSTCVDLQTEDTSCGKCGHSCLGDGCDKGSCKPFDLLTGLNLPNQIATSDHTDQVVFNAPPALYSCAKTGCGNAPAALFSTATYSTHADSPLCLTGGTGDGEEYATLVHDTGSGRFYVAELVKPPRTTGPATNTEPSGLSLSPVGFAGGHEPSGHGSVAIEGAYDIYECRDGLCNSPLKYTGEAGQYAVAIQDGAPGNVLWSTDGANVEYCVRGSADAGLCTPTHLAANAPTSDSGATAPFVIASSTTAYWVVVESANVKIVSCPMPGGCTDAKVLVDGLTAVDGFVADDKGLYWTDKAGGAVRACLDTTAGCGTTPIVLASNMAQPTGIALDSTYIFVTQTAVAAGEGKVTRIVR